MSGVRVRRRQGKTAELASQLSDAVVAQVRLASAGAKERPILFSDPMVRAILAGTKTQTRRLIHPQPPSYLVGREFRPIPTTDLFGAFAVRGTAAACHSKDTIRCPFPVGSRLWVKETHRIGVVGNTVYFRADGDGDKSVRWRPSIFMRRAHSRINLEITGIRIERLLDISAADAQAEGIAECWRAGDVGLTARQQFENLWDSINGARAAWRTNPFVWVVEFRRLAS